GLLFGACQTQLARSLLQSPVWNANFLRQYPEARSRLLVRMTEVDLSVDLVGEQVLAPLWRVGAMRFKLLRQVQVSGHTFSIAVLGYGWHDFSPCWRTLKNRTRSSWARSQPFQRAGTNGGEH